MGLIRDFFAQHSITDILIDILKWTVKIGFIYIRFRADFRKWQERKKQKQEEDTS